MDASIIIVTKNQKEHLIKTLPVLKKQTFKGEFEIIVVDSGSTNGAVEYIKSLPVKLVSITPTTFNFASAFNTGAKQAKGEYLIRLSGDAIPVGNTWLHEMIKPFKDKTVGGVYGRYTITNTAGYSYPDFWPEDRFPKTLTKYKATPTFMMGVNFFGKEFGDEKVREYIFNFAGGCCATRKTIWEKRPLNEKLLAGEDAEYAWFLHLIDYIVVCNPEAKVIHEHKVKKKKNSYYGNLGISKWQWSFNWQIAKYWIKRIFGTDPYRDFKNPRL